MIYVDSAEYKGNFRIWCKFNNGKSGIVNLKNKLWGPVFDPLKSEENFKKFKISNVLHTIVWYNDADLAPEFLYENLEK